MSFTHNPFNPSNSPPSLSDDESTLADSDHAAVNYATDGAMTVSSSDDGTNTPSDSNPGMTTPDSASRTIASDSDSELDLRTPKTPLHRVTRSADLDADANGLLHIADFLRPADPAESELFLRTQKRPLAIVARSEALDNDPRGLEHISDFLEEELALRSPKRILRRVVRSKELDADADGLEHVQDFLREEEYVARSGDEADDEEDGPSPYVSFHLFWKNGGNRMRSQQQHCGH